MLGFSDKPPSEAPLHDDKERSLVITDFSAQVVPEVNSVFAYQNYVIRNLERRLFTGLSHFISQYQSLKRSLVATSKRFTDARTEQNSPISLLHSVAYDPLILVPHKPSQISIRHLSTVMLTNPGNFGVLNKSKNGRFRRIPFPVGFIFGVV